MKNFKKVIPLFLENCLPKSDLVKMPIISLTPLIITFNITMSYTVISFMYIKYQEESKLLKE